MLRHVTVKKLSELSGLTDRAINSLIDKGEWLEGVVWKKTPHGRRVIDTHEYDKWCESGYTNHLKNKRG
jgi:hypothetical protein